MEFFMGQVPVLFCNRIVNLTPRTIAFLPLSDRDLGVQAEELRVSVLYNPEDQEKRRRWIELLNQIRERMVTFPRSALLPTRVDSSVDVVGALTLEKHTFAIEEPHFGDVVNLPDPMEGCIFVVSRMVLASLNGTRRDVFSVGRTVFDENNRVLCALGFSRA